MVNLQFIFLLLQRLKWLFFFLLTVQEVRTGLILCSNFLVLRIVCNYIETIGSFRLHLSFFIYFFSTENVTIPSIQRVFVIVCFCFPPEILIRSWFPVDVFIGNSGGYLFFYILVTAFLTMGKIGNIPAIVVSVIFDFFFTCNSIIAYRT